MNIKKLNGSFIIEVDGLPYHTKIGDKYYSKTLQLFNSSPELFEIEKDNIVQEKTYSQLREEEYGSIKEQLDMIYWDRINGTNKWIDKITEIKNKYPKE